MKVYKMIAKVALWFFGLILVILLVAGMSKNENTQSGVDSKFYKKYENYSNREMQDESLDVIKKSAYSFVENSEMLPNEYKDTYFDCLGAHIFDKNEDFEFKKMMSWCQEEYELKDGKATYFNKAWLYDEVSRWDGSYKPLVEAVKESMNDESSYEHVKTMYSFVLYGIDRPYMQVRMSYRGFNVFGAIVKNEVTIKVDARTKEIFDIEQ